jgi:hypothetical protein
MSLQDVDIAVPANARLIAYLTRYPSPALPLFAAPDRVKDPWMSLGSHPDVVERLWKQLGPPLPDDCRGIVSGSPALVHPVSGIVLALGMGTQYGLRLGVLVDEALRAGARVEIPRGKLPSMNVQRDLGEEWVFGRWLKQEIGWCRFAYEAYGNRS